MAPWHPSSSSAYPSPSSPALHPHSSPMLHPHSSPSLQPKNPPPPKPSAALYAFAHRLLSASKLSLPVVLVALRFLERYYAVQRRRTMATPFDMIVAEGLVLADANILQGGEGVAGRLAGSEKEAAEGKIRVSGSDVVGAVDAQKRYWKEQMQGWAPEQIQEQQAQAPPAVQMNSFNLLISALMASNKFLDDARYSNRWWSKISEMPLRDVNASEHAFLEALGWGLKVGNTEYDAWVERMQRFARAIEESERCGDLSPSVSPNLPVRDQASPRIGMHPGGNGGGVNPNMLAQALAGHQHGQQPSPRSPYVHSGSARSSTHSLQGVQNVGSPMWMSAGPPPAGVFSGANSPAVRPGLNIVPGMGAGKVEPQPGSATSQKATEFFMQQEALFQLFEVKDGSQQPGQQQQPPQQPQQQATGQVPFLSPQPQLQQQQPQTHSPLPPMPMPIPSVVNPQQPISLTPHQIVQILSTMDPSHPQYAALLGLLQHGGVGGGGNAGLRRQSGAGLERNANGGGGDAMDCA
ncbi:hypothetical protein HDU97_009792 [Phlyctochytrium planicorne]|nr:hypothetical protein HDU97_009792 [Phlyctochytrium planicorne]